MAIHDISVIIFILINSVVTSILAVIFHEMSMNESDSQPMTRRIRPKILEHLQHHDW